MSAPETVALRDRTEGQLLTDLEETRHQLFNLRFQAATRQLADVSQVGRAKRRIARIQTLLREREILALHDAASGSTAAPAAAPTAAEVPMGDEPSEPEDATAEADDPADGGEEE